VGKLAACVTPRPPRTRYSFLAAHRLALGLACSTQAIATSNCMCDKCAVPISLAFRHGTQHMHAVSLNCIHSKGPVSSCHPDAMMMQDLGHATPLDSKVDDLLDLDDADLKKMLSPDNIDEVISHTICKSYPIIQQSVIFWLAMNCTVMRFHTRTCA